MENVQPGFVVLRKEWDYSPHIEDNKSIILTAYDSRDGLQDDSNSLKSSLHCHAIRKLERDYLMDFFQRRHEGALLVSGRRGVGKTSAIVAAILASQTMLLKEQYTNSKDQMDSMRLLPVLVNAPNFEIRKTEKDSDNQSKDAVDLSDFKRVVLQNLVRGLYQAAVRERTIDESDSGELVRPKQDGKSKANYSKITSSFMKKLGIQRNTNGNADYVDLKNKISYLFRKAVAKEVKTESNLKEIDLEKHFVEKQAIFGMNWSHVAMTTVISVISAVVAAVYLAPILKLPDLLTKIAPIFVAITPPCIAMSWQVKKMRTNQTEAERSASIYYLYDYDTSTLQFELEETIRLLADNRWKVIFIIDELDKIEAEANVIDVIKSLKALLNQASALFVLIGGEEFFRLVEVSSENRGKGYTMFSQRIFIRRPQFVEITRFMDKIVDPSSRGTITKLFTWDQIEEKPIRFRDILNKNSVDDYLFDIIKDDAYITKNNDFITISVNRELEEGNPRTLQKYFVEIMNDDSEPDAKLIIPSKDRNGSIEYEFAVMKDNDNKSFVYTRTRQYRDFQYYAAYASRSDFFDLYNVIRDNIFYSISDGKPRLNIKLEGRQLTQAKLQEILTEVYYQEAYSSPSKWRENDRLLTLMYSLITTFSDLRGIATRLRVETTPRFKIVFLDDRDTTLFEVPNNE